MLERAGSCSSLRRSRPRLPVHAQRIWVGGPGGGFWRGGPPKFGMRDDFDGSFNYCRGFYNSVTREMGGSGWGTDYPAPTTTSPCGSPSSRSIRVKLDTEGQPAHIVLRLTDPLLSALPAALHGGRRHGVNSPTRNVRAARLPRLKGGFLWVDDFWGSTRGTGGSPRSARVLPPHRVSDRRHSAITHPIMRMLHDVQRYAAGAVDQPLGTGSGGQTSETRTRQRGA